MPDSTCDAQSFIICWGKLAFVKDVCGSGKRFNRNTGWCEPKEDVPLPPGCREEITPVKAPKSCADITDGYIPHPTTCKKYIWCVRGGFNYTMSCQKLAYFISGEGYNRCMFDIEHYQSEIPEDQLADCRRKDPYTAADFTKTTTKRV
ncbi:hypothetical protein Btru_027067 [Bulinus truncatus]|nr:hypothetical protein Btru_027067 [Bulinus truncatus]